MSLFDLGVKTFDSKRALNGLLALVVFGAVLSNAEAQNRKDETQLRKMGLEIEYALANQIETKPENIDPKVFQFPLTVARKVLHTKNPVEVATYDKAGRILPIAKFTDNSGRTWKVVPESVNTTGLDGLEFVSPPLETDADDRALEAILEKTMAKGTVTSGLRSAVHVTLDVSDMIQNGNASQLVDTILLIESSWAEIYAGISPQRYGTIVNRFGVPLAADQQELLQELAALVPEKRTFDAVKAIFQRHHAREIRLKEGNESKAWKYRAANYGKMFGLTADGITLPVIEFRIPDYGSAKEVMGDVAFFRAVIDAGARLKTPIRSFRSPFAGVANTDSKTLSERVASLTADRYEKFLKLIGYTSGEYPMWKTNAEAVKAVQSSPSALREELLSRYDFNKPFEIAGKNVTIGFEAEFRGGNAKKVVDLDANENPKPKLDKFPFLDPKASKEGTGNYEVRSVPAESLGEIQRQMNLIRKTLGPDLRGFHLHFRFPKAAYDEIGESRANSWLSRMGDVIAAWRLQNRRHFFALKAWSQTRNSPTSLSGRGTIRVQNMGEEIDVEIRGYMGAVDEIVEIVQLIMTGVKNPEHIKGFETFQTLSFEAEQTLTGFMEAHIRQYEKRALTDAEKTFLLEMASSAVEANQIWPLFKMETAPYLNEFDRSRIRSAKFEFAKSVRIVMKNHLELNKYEGKQEEAEKQFRWRIKRWAQTVDINQLLLDTALMDPKVDDTQTLPLAAVRAYLKSHPYASYEGPVITWLDHLSAKELYDLVTTPNFTDNNVAVVGEALFKKRSGLTEMQLNILLRKVSFKTDNGQSLIAKKILAVGDHPATDKIILAALRSGHGKLRDFAVAMLPEMKSASMKMFALAIQSKSPQTRATALASLSKRAGWEDARKLFDSVVDDRDASVRTAAAKVYPMFPQEDRFADVRKLIRDKNADVASAAAASLAKLPVADISPFVIEMLNSDEVMPAQVRTSLLTAWQRFVAVKTMNAEIQRKIRTVWTLSLERAPGEAVSLLPTLFYLQTSEMITLIGDLIATGKLDHKSFLEQFAYSPTKDELLKSPVVISYLEKVVLTVSDESSIHAWSMLLEAGTAALQNKAFELYHQMDKQTRAKMVESIYNIKSKQILPRLYKSESNAEIRANIIQRFDVDAFDRGNYENDPERVNASLAFATAVLLSNDPVSIKTMLARIQSNSYYNSFAHIALLAERMLASNQPAQLARVVKMLDGQRDAFLKEESAADYLQMLLESGVTRSSRDAIIQLAKFLPNVKSPAREEKLKAMLDVSQPRVIRAAAAYAMKTVGSTDKSLLELGLTDPDAKIRSMVRLFEGAPQVEANLKRRNGGAVPIRRLSRGQICEKAFVGAI